VRVSALCACAGDATAAGKAEVKTEAEQPFNQAAASHNEGTATSLDGRGGGAVIGGLLSHGAPEATPACVQPSTGMAAADNNSRGTSSAQRSPDVSPAHTHRRSQQEYHVSGAGGGSELHSQSAFHSRLPSGR
jgi:hypothetical protein